IKITPDAQLKIKSVGLLGDKFIDMNVGSQQGERLPEGSMIPTTTGGGLDNLSKDAGEVMKEVHEIASTNKEALRYDQGRNVIKEIVTNINDMTASLKRITTGNEDKINKIIDDMEAVTAQLAHETDRYQKDSLMGDLAKVGPILDKVD